jgi:hypothetical protein
MPKKEPDAEKVVDNLHAAVRAFIEARGGNLSQIGPVEIVTHKALSFDVVIRCVGRPSK